MKYAKIDSTNTNPQAVIGWFDADEFDYPNIDFSTADYIQLTDTQWASRLGTPYYDPSNDAFSAAGPAPTLNDVATVQIGTLKGAFAAAAVAPVTDSNGVQWNGGEHSASSIDGAVRLAQNTGATTVDLWDYANTKHSLSISAAQAVVDAVAGAYQAAFQKYQGLRAQVVAIQQMGTRENSTAYKAGAEVTDGNGNIWKCTTAGTSGSKKASWPSNPTASSTVTDGGVVWTFSQTQEAAIKAAVW